MVRVKEQARQSEAFSPDATPAPVPPPRVPSPEVPSAPPKSEAESLQPEKMDSKQHSFANAKKFIASLHKLANIFILLKPTTQNRIYHIINDELIRKQISRIFAEAALA